MFINVVITRVILFCPAVPPSPPSVPSLVPRNATSFVSLLAKLLVLRAHLSLSARARKRARERSVPSQGSLFLSSSRLFRPFQPFFLSPPFCLSLIVQPPFLSLSLCSTRALLLSRSSRCYRSRLSLRSVSLIFLFSLDEDASSLCSPTRGSRIPRRPFPFLPPVPLFYRGWLLFHPSSHRSTSSPRTATVAASPATTSPLPPRPFPSSFFVPVDRGVLHSSNLNAGRVGVLYRLRK